MMTTTTRRTATHPHQRREPDRLRTAFEADESIRRILEKVYDLKEDNRVHVWNACDEIKREELNGIPLRVGSHFEGFGAALRCVLEENLDRGLALLRSLTEGSNRITTMVGSLVEVCVCVILCLYPAICSPKGHDSGSAAALAAAVSCF